MPELLKIAVTGPESTGKSLISGLLAGHYSTVWVPEFARVYLLNIDRPYNYEDILEIARGQMASEKAFEPIANKLLFADTELTVTKIWSMVKYGKCHPWIEEMLANQQYGLYLLMDIDLPWEYDALREHPHMRGHLMEMYISEMDRQGFNYRIISGHGEQRLKNAIAAVEDFLKYSAIN